MTPVKQIADKEQPRQPRADLRPLEPDMVDRDQRARGRDFSPWWESWKVAAIDSPRFSRWVEGIEQRHREAARELDRHSA